MVVVASTVPIGPALYIKPGQIDTVISNMTSTTGMI